MLPQIIEKLTARSVVVEISRQSILIECPGELKIGLSEVLAADGLIGGRGIHHGHAWSATGGADALGLEERAQNGQCQIGVASLNRSV